MQGGKLPKLPARRDISGQVVIPPQFDITLELSEGLCAVWSDEHQKKGFINTTGTLVIDYRFQEADAFKNGRSRVKLNNVEGAIDRTGNFVASPVHRHP